LENEKHSILIVPVIKLWTSWVTALLFSFFFSSFPHSCQHTRRGLCVMSGLLGP